MRLFPVVIVALLAGEAAGSCPWRTPPPAPTPDEAADLVAAAVRKGDRATLNQLAERPAPDPWLLAEELCFRGERGAATKFASLLPKRHDGEALLAAIAAFESGPDATAAREALRESKRAGAAKRLDEALRVLDEVPRPSGILGLRVDFRRVALLARLRRYGDALPSCRTGADAAEELGWRAQAARFCFFGAYCAQFTGKVPAALELHRRRLTIEKARGDRAEQAMAHLYLGIGLAGFGNAAEAIPHYEAALELHASLGKTRRCARTLHWLANALEKVGRLDAALEHNLRSVALFEELGDVRGCSAPLSHVGDLLRQTGRFRESLRIHERARALAERCDDPRTTAHVLGNLALAYSAVGERSRALDLYQRALAITRQLGDPFNEGQLLVNIGNAQMGLGDHAGAIRTLEEAAEASRRIGKPASVAYALGNLGRAYRELNDYERALAFAQQALGIRERIGDKTGVAHSLHNIGIAQRLLGNDDAARNSLEHALAVKRELEDEVGVAYVLSSLAGIDSDRGRFARALERRRQALALTRAVGAREATAALLNDLAHTHLLAGEADATLRRAQEAVRAATELESAQRMMRGHELLAAARLLRGEYALALRAARTAVSHLSTLFARLASEQTASARESWAGMFRTGQAAAIAKGDEEALCFFLESGRAHGLLADLRGRGGVREARIPEELRRVEGEARGRVNLALRRYREAIDEGVRDRIGECRHALEQARGDLRVAVERIQRSARLEADYLYPEPDSLPAIQRRLRPGDVLVLFGLYAEDAAALVVTGKRADIVGLGPTAKLEAACAAVTELTPEKDAAKAAGRLKDMLAPALRGDIRLIVAPHGALASVPFALLTDVETVLVPSASTYGALFADTARGEGVLALGDPDYGDGSRSPRALPATRREVEAIGDVVLAGRSASKSRLFEALKSRPRWRAVHLACHGLVQTDAPMLSSLALTSTESDDGLLTVLDVFRARIPADLAVLSACETARGKIYEAEGVIGFARAFMLAGAPRVVVSLWKVDDEATRVLMVRFYELWKKLPTATALRRAQEHVASHEKWRHPYYWAAWQLWGRAD